MIVYIQESTRPGKKWMAQVREDGMRKTVHFGQRGHRTTPSTRTMPAERAIWPDTAARRTGTRWCADTGVAIAVAPVGEAIDGASHSERIDNVR
jgi:hypothetical protein